MEDGLNCGLELGFGTRIRIRTTSTCVTTRSYLKAYRCLLNSVLAEPTTTTTMADGRIYVGNLPMDIQERDIEDLFFKYGKVRDIELKNNRGTIPFAFVRFEDPR